MILTHLHPDHASGYFRIKEAFSDLISYSNCHPLAENVQPDMVRWVHEELSADVKHRCLKAGQKIKFYDAEIAVLWPEVINNNNLNYNSLVLYIIMPDLKILVMADADQEVENILLEMHKLPETIDVLIVGHHGAGDATNKTFIKHIKPERAVISVNANNIRGYPSADVIQRLQSHGIELLRTDVRGDIHFK